MEEAPSLLNGMYFDNSSCQGSSSVIDKMVPLGRWEAQTGLKTFPKYAKNPGQDLVKFSEAVLV